MVVNNLHVKFWLKFIHRLYLHIKYQYVRIFIFGYMNIEDWSQQRQHGVF